MPVGLSPSSEDYHIVHVVPLLKEHCACECGAERCYFGGVEESARAAGTVEESETTMLCG